MRTYIDIFLLAVVIIYIVDLSGFTESWRSALARWLKVATIKPMKPFDCSLCMVWWVCIIYACTIHAIRIDTLLFIAMISFLSSEIGQILRLIKETIKAITNKLFDKIWK